MSTFMTYVVRTLSIITAISFVCWWLVPHQSQAEIDLKVRKLSERINQASFGNFSLIERDAVFSFLQSAFRAPVWSVAFYVRVAAFATFITVCALSIHIFVPLSDPLNVQLVGYAPFIWAGFFVPSAVISVLSMILVVMLLALSGIFRNAAYYLILCIADAMIVCGLFAVISYNLELTRDYLESVYLHRGYYAPSHVFSQLFFAFRHVVEDPSLVKDIILGQFYTAEKYTSYYLTVTTMFVALLPTLIHLLAAAVIFVGRLFHDVVRTSVAYALFRISELNSIFRFVMSLCGAILGIIAFYRSFL